MLFVTRKGRPISTGKLRAKVLDPILERLKITTEKQCGLYAFRHGNATLLDSLGTPLKTRQSRLGHADPSITLTHYTHAVDAEDMAVADRIGALVGPGAGLTQ